MFIPEENIFAVDDKVQRGVDDVQKVVDSYDVLDEDWLVELFFPGIVIHVVEFDTRDDDLADVAYQEQDDDADEHQGDVTIAPPAGLLLGVRVSAFSQPRRFRHLLQHISKFYFQKRLSTSFQTRALQRRVCWLTIAVQWTDTLQTCFYDPFFSPKL